MNGLSAIWFTGLMPAMAVFAQTRGGRAAQSLKSCAASYARYSSENQDDRTIADQQRVCRERAARDGNRISSKFEFADEAVSGAKHQREKFDALMEAARRGEFNTLYFVNLSRLARDCVLTLQTLRELVYVLKRRVISIDEGIDTAHNDNWELMAAIFGVQNQQYLKHLAAQVFRGLEGIVLEGHCAGDYCFGYSSEPIPGTERHRKGRDPKPLRRYIIDWQTAEWVIKIFHWFVMERKSINWITRELNRLGAPKDHRATTKEWRHQYVTHLLKNSKYIGKWPWGEKQNVRNPMDGTISQEDRSPAETEKWLRHFPELQIIDNETYEQAQIILARNAEAHGHRRGEKGRICGSTGKWGDAHPRHLLARLMRCGHCGRRLNVGGARGKYLFCPGYRMGVCPCQTTLRRDLAEQRLLEAIGQRIFSNPKLFDHLLEVTGKAYEKLQRELPTSLRATEKALSDVERRIEKLLENSEEGRVPDLEKRLARRCDERDTLRAKLAKLQKDAEGQAVPPTRDWIMSRLTDLHSLLRGGGPAAAHALRGLVGGKIVVTEIRRPGRDRHYLQGRVELRLQHCIDAIGVVDEIENDGSPPELIIIDFRQRPRFEEIAGEVKQHWDEGLTVDEICVRLKCSRTPVQKALNFWHESRGLQRPDGRACKKRLKGRRKADRQQAEIMRLFELDMPVMKIAEKLGCCAEIVREAVEKWHTERGLPIPDGRTRRREIREKKKRPEA